MTALNNGWKAEARADLGRMQVGEERIYTATDKEGRVLKEIKIVRTDRPYVYDLCDAYNQAISPDAEARGLSYEVVNGEVKIGFSQAFSKKLTKELEAKMERERRDYIHRQRYPMREAAE